MAIRVANNQSLSEVTSIPSSISGGALTLLSTETASDSGTVDFNFGATPFGDTAISSGNTDGEYGNFEYTTTITGDSVSKTFKALCTKNLAEYG